MIIEYLLGKLSGKDPFVFGMYLGLFLGLFLGAIVLLGGGFTVNLIGGLIVIVFFSLLAGGFVDLNEGILFGLGSFIICFSLLGLASLIIRYPTFIPLWILIILGIIILEALFWLDKSKPSGWQNKITFTLLKKGEALLETIAILGCLNLIRLAIEKIKIFEHWDIVLKWVGYIGVGIICLGVLFIVGYIYLKLNSLKYAEKIGSKRKKKKVKKK